MSYQLLGNFRCKLGHTSLFRRKRVNVLWYTQYITNVTYHDFRWVWITDPSLPILRHQHRDLYCQLTGFNADPPGPCLSHTSHSTSQMFSCFLVLISSSKSGFLLSLSFDSLLWAEPIFSNIVLSTSLWAVLCLSLSQFLLLSRPPCF